MPIVAADIQQLYTIKTGASGYASAGTAAGSLGKYASTTETGTDLHDTVTGAENAASEAEYKVIAAHNAHATLTLESARAYFSAEVAGGADSDIGIDPTYAVVARTAQCAVEITDENTAPAPAVTWVRPTTYAAGLALGNILATNVRAIHVRRTAANTVAVNNDGVTIKIEGDTAA